MLRHLANAIAQLPNAPSVYAMYGGRGRGLHVAYVGIADDLRGRINQHLLRRDSSDMTGVSAVASIPTWCRRYVGGLLLALCSEKSWKQRRKSRSKSSIYRLSSRRTERMRI